MLVGLAVGVSPERGTGTDPLNPIPGPGEANSNNLMALIGRTGHRRRSSLRKCRTALQETGNETGNALQTTRSCARPVQESVSMELRSTGFGVTRRLWPDVWLDRRLLRRLIRRDWSSLSGRLRPGLICRDDPHGDRYCAASGRNGRIRSLRNN